MDPNKEETEEFKTWRKQSQSTAMMSKERSLYTSFAVDFVSDTFIAITVNQDFKDEVPHSGCFSEGVKKYSETMVGDRDRPIVQKFLTPEFLSENLTMNGSQLTLEFAIFLQGKPSFRKVIVYPDSFADDGKITKAILSFQSIDQEKINERRNNEIDRRYRAFLSVLSKTFVAEYYITLPEGTYSIFRTNNRLARVYSRVGSWDQLIKDYAPRYVEEEQQDSFVKRLLSESLRTELKEKASLEVHYRSPYGGRTLWFALLVAVVSRDDQGFPKEMIAAVKDTSEFMQTIEQKNHDLLAATQAKDDFLAQMSHDLRTPLNGIVGMTQIAMRSSDDRQRVEDCLRKIDLAAYDLLTFANDSLELANLESGTLDLDEESFSLKNRVRELAESFMKQAQDVKETMTTDLTDLPESLYRGSWIHIKWILTVLLTNAIKFNKAGGKITFIARRKPRTDDNDMISFLVMDTGIGMSLATLSHATEPPSDRKESALNRTTGMGLPFVKALTNRLGGRVIIGSLLNEGSEIEVVFPLKEIKSTLSNNIKDASGLRVLSADDNYLNLEILTTLLEEAGVQVDTAENGKAAVDKFFASAPGYYDAILMDIMMPVMDGLAATKAIRSLPREDSKTIPLIVISANAFPKDEKASLTAGADAHLPKPVDTGRLLELLAAIKVKKGSKK